MCNSKQNKTAGLTVLRKRISKCRLKVDKIESIKKKKERKNRALPTFFLIAAKFSNPVPDSSPIPPPDFEIQLPSVWPPHPLSIIIKFFPFFSLLQIKFRTGFSKSLPPYLILTWFSIYKYIVPKDLLIHHTCIVPLRLFLPDPSFCRILSISQTDPGINNVKSSYKWTDQTLKSNKIVKFRY